MSFAKSSKKAEDVKQSGGGGYINGSGVYPINIIAPFVSVSNGGSESVDMFLEHSGQKQVLYGNLRTSNNDGTSNKIGAKVFNQLMIIAGLDDCADPIEGELPIGQKGKMKDAAVLEDLCDIDILMRVQMEYSAHNGNIQEKKVIKGFYRAEDNATAEEIVNETEVGKGFEGDQKYVNNITFKDGLTPEAITAWIAAKRPKGTAGDAAGSGGGTDKKDPPAFGKKRFGKSEEA
mgnify:CR=1 FL=1